MFTGIVEATGQVAEITTTVAGCRLGVSTVLAPELRQGDSLAVNGVCLTVTVTDGEDVHFDLGPETAAVTTLGGLQRLQRVNLERALRLDGRLGGHYVLGHVDGVGRVEHIRPEGESHWLTIAYPEPLTRYFIHKGSIAVDGVSLTVAGLTDLQFDVQIVPFTWGATTLSDLAVGRHVNLECDMIGKYVVGALTGR